MEGGEYGNILSNHANTQKEGQPPTCESWLLCYV